MRFVSREELGLTIAENIGRGSRRELGIYGLCLHHESIQSLQDSVDAQCHLCLLVKSSLADTEASTQSIMSQFLSFDPKSLYVSRQDGQYGSFNESHWHLDWHYEGRQYKMRMGDLRGPSTHSCKSIPR
jgi:hypothetical protein